ncbi:peroxidase [Bacillus timonensis]|nr:peroxidase [Bacillus timonensis]
MLTKDDELVEGLKTNYLSLNLEEKERGILDYAVKLTKSPHSVKDEDVERLRSLGCSDTEILDVCQITSYFNFINRMAEGLGVQLEKEFDEYV